MADSSYVYPWRWADPAQTTDWMNRVEDTGATPLVRRAVSYEGLDLTRAWLRGYSTGTNAFRNAKLVGADFANANYTGLQFSGANLSSANFAGANLSYAVFGGIATPAAYQPATLDSARFSGATITYGQFTGASAVGADFRATTFQNANFTSANLTNASFVNAALNGVILNNAVITGADFSRTAVALSPALTASTLGTTKSFSDRNLQGVKFDGMDLRSSQGWNFSNQNLNNASFRNADITSTSLYNATITGADFSRDAAAIGSGLAWPTLLQTKSFMENKLQGVRFEGLNLAGIQGWNFGNLDLTGASFRGASLEATPLANANLSNASLYNANLASTTLSGATIAGADFSRDAQAVGSGLSAGTLASTKSFFDGNLQGVKFDGLEMPSTQGWTFVGQNLSGASFRGANLTGTSFRNADLTQLSFQGADVRNADLSGSGRSARAANFSHAQLDSANLSGRDLTQASFQNASLTGTSFSGTLLTMADFRGATGSIPVTGQTNEQANVIMADGRMSAYGSLSLTAPSTTSWKISAHTLPVTATTFAIANNSLELQSGANLISSGPGTIGAGGHLINNGSITVSAPWGIRVYSGGTLSGSGSISAARLVNEGLVSPGNSPGTLTINGDFQNTGTVLLEIGGSDPSQYDRLIVNGNIYAGGTIQMVFTDGFVPQDGEEFDLLSWTGSLQSGSFNFVTMDLPPGVEFTPQWTSQGLSFTAAVPEPTFLVTAIAGAGAMLLARRRNRHRR